MMIGGTTTTWVARKKGTGHQCTPTDGDGLSERGQRACVQGGGARHGGHAGAVQPLSPGARPCQMLPKKGFVRAWPAPLAADRDPGRESPSRTQVCWGRRDGGRGACGRSYLKRQCLWILGLRPGIGRNPSRHLWQYPKLAPEPQLSCGFWTSRDQSPE